MYVLPYYVASESKTTTTSVFQYITRLPANLVYRIEKISQRKPMSTQKRSRYEIIYLIQYDSYLRCVRFDKQVFI